MLTIKTTTLLFCQRGGGLLLLVAESMLEVTIELTKDFTLLLCKEEVVFCF